MSNRRLKILVSGMIAADPWQGGATWAVLQYALGFARLGYQVYLVEPIRPESIQPLDASLAASENARYFSQVMADFGLVERSALLQTGTRQTVGLPYAQLWKAAQHA